VAHHIADQGTEGEYDRRKAKDERNGGHGMCLLRHVDGVGGCHCKPSGLQDSALNLLFSLKPSF
jgi:hypothetical protein